MPTNSVARNGTTPPLSSAERLRVLRLSDGEIEAEARERSKGRFATPTMAAGISPVAVRWLWEAFVPLGALTLLYGEEGLGKSALTMALAAAVTLGLLDGTLKGRPAGVEILAFEDDPAAVLVPRLRAAGADLERVGFLDPELSLPEDAAALEAALAERDTKLVIVDPLSDGLREGLKDNNNGDVRSALVPLQAAAARLGVAVLGVAHPNKAATSAANKVMGSKAWRAVPRSVLLYGRDPEAADDDGRRALAVSKSNYAARASVHVRVESAAVKIGDEQTTQPRAVIGGRAEFTDRDVLMANEGLGAGDRPKTKAEAARDLVMRMLDGAGGEMEASAILAAGDSANLSTSTMQRAKRDLGVIEESKRWKLSGVPL